MKDSFDNVYSTPDERDVPDREPVMTKAKDWKIVGVLFGKNPKQVIVDYARAAADGSETGRDQAVFANSAFRQFVARAPKEGEDLGDQVENAAYEALVAKNRIPPDAVKAS